MLQDIDTALASLQDLDGNSYANQVLALCQSMAEKLRAAKDAEFQELKQNSVTKLH